METAFVTEKSKSAIKLNPSWLKVLGPQFDLPYMKSLKKFLRDEVAKKKIIYPKMSNVFKALNTTSFEDVKVVIIGQDPYHGPGQAHGLCFSVQKPTPPPPSLQNIFLELKADQKIEKPKHGDLSAWAKQGVLLLNTVLTVEDGKAASHHGKGWEQFTDEVIKVLDREKKDLVFILWGSPAQKKEMLLTPMRHLILKSPHPSPLSAYRGFFGSKPFTKTNLYLKSKGIKEIDWSL
jgi:uracil-DNA glycosylase